MNAFRMAVVRQLVGVRLLGLTLAVECLLGGFVRWLVAWLAGTVAGLFVALPFNVQTGAWAVALAPVIWSALAIVVPSRGAVWRRSLGGRRPTADEKLAYEDALALLRATAPHLSEPRTWFVLDDAQPHSAVIGRTLMVSRGVFDLGALVPVMAHELGHIASTDGLLTDALNRLVFWGDPWSVVQRLFSRIWSMYWRYREYDADAYAAALGCADDLAQHLLDEHLILDTPVPHLLFNPASHPPVALRIDRLRKAADHFDRPYEEVDLYPFVEEAKHLEEELASLRSLDI
jgi:Zn-dependent protease with chaperone function